MVIKLKTRRFVVKKNEGYGVPSKGLIKSWNVVQKDLKFIPFLVVDEYLIRGVPRKDRLKIDIEEIRRFIRSPDRDPDEYNLDNFESIAYINQLYALEFYKTLTDEQLFSSLFTRDYKKVQVSFGENGPDEVEIEEEYWDKNDSAEITSTDNDLEIQKKIKENGIKPVDKSCVMML
jgi:hypothetical protein